MDHYAYCGLGGPLAGLASAADKPLDQSTIISVKPAVPEAVKKAMEEQKKQAKASSSGGWFQKKVPPPQGGYGYVPPSSAKASGGWFQKKPAPQGGYGYVPPPPAKPSSGKSFLDIFNPAKWGKGNQQTPQARQQQMQNQRLQDQIKQQNQPATWNQQEGVQPANPGQMPPPNIASPTSQPG